LEAPRFSRNPIVGVLAAILLLGAPASAPAADGRALYRAAVEADDMVSYSGTLTSVVYEGDRAESTVARIEHKAPHSWRIWYLAPADAYGRMIVSNEQLTYQYEPGRNRVYSNDWNTTAPGIAEPVDISRVEKNYAVDIGPVASIAGRNALALSLVSKHRGTLAERLWLDSTTKLILRRENYRADGTIASKSGFDNIKITADFPRELFDLSVPAGMTLLHGTTYGKATRNISELISSLKFKFADPKYIPEGFSLVKGSIASPRGIDTLQLVYGDGLQTFSLFENGTGQMPSFDRATPKPIQIGSSAGQYADLDGQTLVSWNAGGINFTIVGNLPTKEVSKIGASIDQ